jgi:hypothetical protein
MAQKIFANLSGTGGTGPSWEGLCTEQAVKRAACFGVCSGTGAAAESGSQNLLPSVATSLRFQRSAVTSSFRLCIKLRRDKMARQAQYAVHACCFFCGEIDLRFSARSGLLTDNGRLGNFLVKSSTPKHQLTAAIRNQSKGQRSVFGVKMVARRFALVTATRNINRACATIFSSFVSRTIRPWWLPS